MQHRLVGPLAQQRRNRVLLAIEYQAQGFLLLAQCARVVLHLLADAAGHAVREVGAGDGGGEVADGGEATQGEDDGDESMFHAMHQQVIGIIPLSRRLRQPNRRYNIKTEEVIVQGAVIDVHLLYLLDPLF